MAETQDLIGVSAHCQQSLRAGASWKLHVYDLLVPQFSPGSGNDCCHFFIRRLELTLRWFV